VAASDEWDPLGRVGILALAASQPRKEKAALERPNYHLTEETPALAPLPPLSSAAVVVVAAAAAAAAAWQGKDKSKKDEVVGPMFVQDMDTEEGRALSGDVHLLLRYY